MNHTQKVLFPVQLPSVIVEFKNNFVTQILSPIDRAIQSLQTASDPVIFLLLIVIFFQLIRIAINQVKNSKKASGVSQVNDPHLISKEIKDLKKQLKSVQNSVKQLKEQGMKSPLSQGMSNPSNQGVDIEKLISKYRSSWQKRERIAEHILDYQFKLIKQVKKIKKSSRISVSASKITSNSAIKSKVKEEPLNGQSPILTTEKKVQKEKENHQIERTEDKNTPNNSIKKEVIKSIEPRQQTKPVSNIIDYVIEEKIDFQQGKPEVSETPHHLQEKSIPQTKSMISEIMTSSIEPRKVEEKGIEENSNQGQKESMTNQLTRPIPEESENFSGPSARKPLPPKPTRPKDPRSRGVKIPLPPGKKP